MPFTFPVFLTLSEKGFKEFGIFTKVAKSAGNHTLPQLSDWPWSLLLQMGTVPICLPKKCLTGSVLCPGGVAGRDCSPVPVSQAQDSIKEYLLRTEKLVLNPRND